MIIVDFGTNMFEASLYEKFLDLSGDLPSFGFIEPFQLSQENAKFP
jgi:hypothetical protein